MTLFLLQNIWCKDIKWPSRTAKVESYIRTGKQKQSIEDRILTMFTMQSFFLFLSSSSLVLPLKLAMIKTQEQKTRQIIHLMESYWRTKKNFIPISKQYKK